MKTLLFVISLLAFLATPAFAQLGPAGVPGAPGLAPEPASAPAPDAPATPTPPPQPAEQPAASAPEIPAACAKAKNKEHCVKRLEAKAACKGKSGENYKQCVKDHSKSKKHPTKK